MTTDKQILEKLKRVYYSIKGWVSCHILRKHTFILRGFTSLNYKGINIISGELSEPEELEYCYYCGSKR